MADGGLDLRQTNALPSNIEAEQALLGVLLYDNGAFERIEDGLKPIHFFEPVHQRVFEAIETLIMRNSLAEPMLLSERFKADEALLAMGGVRYLADLVDRAPPTASAADYSREILDLAMRRELILTCRDAAVEAGTDWDQSARDHIEGVEQKLYSLAEHKASAGFREFSDYLAGAVSMAAEAYARDGGMAGVATGLIDIDKKLGGLHPSDLLILAARPSMGKTSLATNIAYNVAKAYAYEMQPDGSKKTMSGGVVAFFSLEMSGEQLAMRILAEVSGVSGDRTRKGEIEANEFARIRDASLEIQNSPIHIDATGAISISKLAARARRLKRTHGLDLIVVDYLQLMTGSKSYKGGERVQEVSEITQGLKSLAKELECPVIALSQLSRQVESREDKRPQLSDLRESGSIEQDADVVAFIYREEYYLGRAEPKPDTQEHLAWQDSMNQCRGVADLIIAKQRHGPIGTVKLSFTDEITKFGNLAHEGQYQGARMPYGGDE